VTTASIATTFQHTVLSGSLLLAIPVAALAGLVSFLSPCVVPLVPGYLAYVTGMSGAELGDGSVRKSRMLAGSALFVVGFSIALTLGGALFGYVGSTLAAHRDVVYRVLGVVVIVFGCVFLGLFPGLQREIRIHRLPAAGLAAAPIVGFAFGVGWTPCLGPTLGAVQALALAGSSASQGALLTFVYCLGLGIPFILVAIGFRRALGALAVVRRHQRLVSNVGGVMLLLVGFLLVSGLWTIVVGALQHLVTGYTAPL
jgi:cytochrome c-type biogenesis protein